jgi:predicted transcriptional regulator
MEKRNRHTLCGDMEHVLTYKKRVALLIGIHNSKNAYPRIIAKGTKVAYSHATKIFSEFKNGGLMTTTREGKCQILRLTTKGKELAKLLIGINTLLRK